MNENTNNNIIENPEPDWSLEMFSEDILDLINKLFEMLKSLFNAFFGE